MRFPRIAPPLLAEAFAEVARTGLTAGVHNEDDESVRAALAQVKAAGIADWRAHGLSRPPLAELLATLQIYETGAATGCPAHVVHCSLSRGYDIAADYRARGFAATIECCIHYLTLDEENDVRRLGGKAKINPPIRPRAEVEKLWRQVAAGNVTLVSTDHVSWSEDKKTDPDMLANASGVPGLEVMVPLFVKGALERGIPLTWAAKLMAENPARHFRLADKGALGFRLFADRNGQDRRALASCFEAVRAPFPVAGLGDISRPVLVVTGEDDEQAGAAGPLAALIPGARAFTVPKRDHMKTVGARVYKEAVLKFLAG